MFAAARIERDADRLEETAVPTDKTTATLASTVKIEIGDATIRVVFGADQAWLHAC
jgi:hypothetical protein